MAFSGDHGESCITFGGYDVEEFAIEDITWHDNIGQHFWAVNLEAVTISSTAGNYTDSNITSSAVVDSGSSYILMPEEDFYDFFDMILATGDIDCEVDWWNSVYCILGDEKSFDSLPELHLVIDGQDYRVPRESLYTNMDDLYYDGVPTSHLWAVEITYISGWNEWLFGLTFLENYYTVYDMQE